jgi:hypothetical protein
VSRVAVTCVVSKTRRLGAQPCAKRSNSPSLARMTLRLRYRAWKLRALCWVLERLRARAQCNHLERHGMGLARQGGAAVAIEKLISSWGEIKNRCLVLSGVARLPPAGNPKPRWR